MSKLKDYSELINNGEAFKAKYNTQEIVISLEKEIDGDITRYKELTISYGANRREHDILINIMSLSNILGSEALKNITIKLLCEMSKNFEKLNITRTVQSPNVLINNRGFRLKGKEFHCRECKNGRLNCCNQCTESNDWEVILAEVLFNFKRYLMNIDKCKDGTILIGRDETIEVGDIIKLDDKVLMIERLLITPGSEFVIIKYKTINEYFVENELDILKNKLKKGTADYEKYTNIFSVINS